MNRILFEFCVTVPLTLLIFTGCASKELNGSSDVKYSEVAEFENDMRARPLQRETVLRLLRWLNATALITDTKEEVERHKSWPEAANQALGKHATDLMPILTQIRLQEIPEDLKDLQTRAALIEQKKWATEALRKISSL